MDSDRTPVGVTVHYHWTPTNTTRFRWTPAYCISHLRILGLVEILIQSLLNNLFLTDKIFGIRKCSLKNQILRTHTKVLFYPWYMILRGAWLTGNSRSLFKGNVLRLCKLLS